MNHICDFTVEVSFDGSGLLGGKHEYAPFLGVHGTFGQYKMEQRVDMISHTKSSRELRSYPPEKRQGEGVFDYDRESITYRTTKPLSFQLANDGPNTRIDENVWYELYCHTRDSGIPEIDKRESAYVERHTQCGLVALNVEDLIKTYKAMDSPKGYFTKVYPLVDQKIVQSRVREWVGNTQRGMTKEKYMKMIQAASMETMKGVLTFHIRMNEFHEHSFSQSIYGARNFDKKSFSAIMPLKNPNPSPNPNPKFSGLKAPKYNEFSPHTGSKDFTPISYTSELGVEKMLGTLEKSVLTPYCKHFIKMPDSTAEPLCQPLNQNVSHLQLPMWVSKTGQVPVANYWSCNHPATRIYPNEAMRLRDLELYGFDEKSERLLVRIASAGLRRHGLDAKTFITEIANHFSLENKATQITELFMVCEEMIAGLALPSGYYMADLRFVRMGLNSGKAKMIIIDSWDRGLMNNISRSDDCDGEEQFEASILRTFAIGRHTLGFKWESPLLNAIQCYLKNTFIYDIGATVTSAYLNTNNERIETKMKDLPMIGDLVDVNSRSDGHCHGLMGSITDAIKRMENGNISPEKLAKIKASQPNDPYFLQRDSQRSIMVLEATGSMEPRILPVEESYQFCRGLAAKKRANKEWIKCMRLKMDERKKQGLLDIGDCFSVEGQAHYTEKQDPQRRISSFYNEDVHATSQELWSYDITLSQMAFAKKLAPGKYQYGAKIADFIRNPSEYAFVFPFNDAKEEWENEVVPFMESVQHQQAISSFCRYSDEKYAEMERSSGEAQPEMESFLAGVAANPKLSIVRLQTRQWRLDADPEKTREMKKFLSSLPGLVKIGYFTEHHIPICHPVIEILCVIQVPS